MGRTCARSDAASATETRRCLIFSVNSVADRKHSSVMALCIMALDCEDATALDERPHSSLAWPLQTDIVGEWPEYGALRATMLLGAEPVVALDFAGEERRAWRAAGYPGVGRL